MPDPQMDKAGKGVADVFKKQIGPLPLGVWIVVILTGLLLAWYINKSRKGSPSDSAPTTENVPGQAAAQFIPINPPNIDNTIQTNDQWALKAVGDLIAHNINAYDAQVAVRKYLAGEDITTEQSGWISMAIRDIGPPPRLPTGGNTIPPPSPTPNPTPTPSPSPTPTTSAPYAVSKYADVYESVPLGQDLYQWTAAIGKAYGVPYSLPIMRQLNPGIDFYINWLPNPTGANYLIPVFRPSGGVPPVKIIDN